MVDVIIFYKYQIKIMEYKFLASNLKLIFI